MVLPRNVRNTDVLHPGSSSVEFRQQQIHRLNRATKVK